MDKLQITILETSDVHGNVLPINYGNNEEENLGLAKLATVIKNERNHSKNVILIDNGDLIQGTPFTYHYVKKMKKERNPMIEILNKLDYDAAIIGNHEFNYGMDIINDAVKQSNFPWLSANILNEETNEPYFGKPYVIKQMGEAKVAILGVTTHYIPNWENPDHIEKLKFDNAFEVTKDWVEWIRRNEKPDVMIVSYHGGFECDLKTGKPTETLTGENQAYRMCKEIEGIDLLLTGHQHRVIADQVGSVLVLQPGFNGQYLGKAEVTLFKKDKKWQMQSKKCSVISVENTNPDMEIMNLAKKYEDAVQQWLDQPIGKINGDMLVTDPLKLRMEDNPLIEFINKVQMYYSGASISNTALFNNTSPGFPKDVTMRDIVSNYIYPNTLKVIRITGKDIKDALERSASYFTFDENGQLTVNPQFSTPKPQHYNYDMWEGIEYVMDVRKPIGERVVVLQKDGETLSLTDEYNVVMNNYRAGGGGDYTMFQHKEVVKDIPTDMSELIANYIMEHKTIDTLINNNWKVVWK
ncbi:bifunctional metallophosphatase/5'-nucleotidase [Sutcliffiella cohnii]